MGAKERLEILVGTQSKGKTQEIIKDLLKRISNLEFEIEERDRRIEKAIEYIENNCNEYYVNVPHYRGVQFINIDELLDILKGEDKE